MFTFNEIWDKLITGDESVMIEAKRAEEIGKSVLETVSAFANEPNLGGGYLLLGVALSSDTLFPVYEAVGVADTDKIQSELATKCRDMLSSPIRPHITVERKNGKNIVMAFIPEAQPHEKPVYIKNKGIGKGAFRRIGPTDQVCTDDDIALFYQLRTHRTYDETPLPETSLDDVDPLALEEYRRARAKINPNAAELDYSDAELLEALACSSRHQGSICLTLAGLVLFGKRSALRRHLPMTRVDYILVEGREWVPDPEHRYTGIDMLEPLVTLVPRLVSHVLSDIPKAFALNEDSVHRTDVPLIPRAVVREAIVNALMHRSLRLRQPVQIIRYSNRLEIRNPGYSLIPEERLGEPGSLSRNEKIAAVLHEIGIAETKGSGIRTMRAAMEKANLTAPLFESDREKDAFSVTLLVHHLFNPEDIEWLAHFKACNLSDDEARSLLVVREVGAINNASYRNINRVDTLTASKHLLRLRDLKLLEQKGKGVATYYIPTPYLIEPESFPPGANPDLMIEPGTTEPVALSALSTKQTAAALGLSTESTGLSTESTGLSTESTGLSTESHPLPDDLTEAQAKLGKRARPDEVKAFIRQLCAWQSCKSSEIANILQRNPHYVLTNYLRPMVQAGELEYLYPQFPEHPLQAYRTPHPHPH